MPSQAIPSRQPGARPVRIVSFNLAVNSRRVSGTLHYPSSKFLKQKRIVPAAILSHGFYGHAVEKKFAAVRKKLLHEGIAVVTFDYSGWNDHAPYADNLTQTFSHEIAELDAVIAFTKQQQGINIHKIGIVGHSMGGTVALARGAEGISTIVTIASPCVPLRDLRDSAKNKGRYNPQGISWDWSEQAIIGPGAWKSLNAFDYTTSLGKIHCPVLFIHGKKDIDVPHSDAALFFKAANSPKQMVLLHDADHDFKSTNEKKELADAISNWFKRYFLQRYTDVVDVFVINRGRVLMVKRGNTVGYYKNTWGTIAGHMEAQHSVLEQAYVELEEETDLRKKDVRLVHIEKPIKIPDASIDKIWNVNAVVFETAKKKIVLDWENTTHCWADAAALKKIDLLKGIFDVFMNAIKNTRFKDEFKIKR